MTRRNVLSVNDGYLVSIRHKNGFITAYSNLQRTPPVKVGAEVKQGDVIGYIGGGSMQPKDVLKLYVRDENSRYVNPLQFLPDLPSAINSTRK
jgi:murein DD-endopeptidase MepM/ murein hydrolase activator NlpD